MLLHVCMRYLKMISRDVNELHLSSFIQGSQTDPVLGIELRLQKEKIQIFTIPGCICKTKPFETMIEEFKLPLAAEEWS